MMWLFFIFMSCVQKETSSPKASLQEWPNDADLIVDVCQKESRLAPICWVYAVSVLGQANRIDEAKAICRKRTGVWKEECYFRLAEEIAAKGNILLGASQCDQARRFRNNCFSHMLSASPTGREDMFQKRKLYTNLGNWPKFDKVLAAVEDGVKKDLLLFVLGLDEPKYVESLCKRIETKEFKRRCR